ncbi:endonuclease domain-containing protein [Erythrobacter sp. WG]|uniref:endonuclease domain-containing protein n=1 Tax=Erythrobacter sp. WG TaxID=2985510 RepID=UPI00226F6476|nr:endonuclease domain-containing protein [Erythrobacter sp. WG]MCX9148184.1 endonuclease domain-containing protein [Erythrobacter sp. WG]
MPTFAPRDTARARRLRREATPAERALWAYLSKSQQGAKFSRQMPVGPFFADFLCRELALVIELDGHSHDIAPERDARRDRWMAEQGFTVLRFTNDDVRGNVEGVVAAIRAEVGRLRGLRGS